MKREKILIIDDDPNILFAVRMIFEKEGYSVVEANGGQNGLQMFETAKPDVVFLDVTMPDMCGLDVMKQMKEGADVPVIIITGYGTMETAIKAIQLGAYEYITKPLDTEKIRLLARRALETFQLKKKVEQLQLRLEKQIQPYVIVGNSLAMQEVYKTIGAITTTPNIATVLLLGESGTGKELVARAIHENGPTASEPFVVVNCTVLPEDLLESELFGHEKGAFTGAVDRKMGKLEQAKNGIIFIDEICEMSQKLQAKLLRLLQEREFERLGGDDVLKVHARFIVATNRNLEDAVKQKQFREDLFFRINVLSIHLPPLRERKDDLPLLVNHFIAKYNTILGGSSPPKGVLRTKESSEEVHSDIRTSLREKNITALGHGVIEKLQKYNFPGNVRELENIIERAMIICKGSVLTTDAVDMTSSGNPSPKGVHSDIRTSLREKKLLIGMEEISLSNLEFHKARSDFLAEFEKKYLQELLTAAKGSITEAAKIAKVRRQSLYRMLKRHNLTPEQFHIA
jgi:DNA-binding NtrC family response regulator